MATETPRKRILYYWSNDYHSSTYPEGRILNESGAEVFFVHNLETAERFLHQGPYDLIAAHIGEPPGGVEFARGARKRYPQTLIIGLQGGAWQSYKDLIIKGLGEDNPFDDIITREAIGEQAIARNIRNLVNILEAVEAKQRAAGIT